MRYLLLISAAVLVMGAGVLRARDGFDLPMCVTSSTDEALALEKVAKSRRTIDFPKVGDIETVEIGESMISTLDYTTYAQGLRLNAPLSFSGVPPVSNRGPFKSRGNFIVQVPAGRPVITAGLSEYLRKPLYVAKDAKVIRPKDGKAFPRAVVGLEPKGEKSLQLVWGWQDVEWRSDPMPADYEIDYCGRWSAGDFRRDLVYSGVSQGTVLISYREFSDSLARAAFTQDVRYDLKDGAEVGFRGARFEIIKATNTEITYRVLKTLGG
ncbi:MAG: hypothetical protein Q7T61_21010 [Caulobacter sp.]|nr:hypothetical protein [Caulobacter sp.]